MSERKFIPLPDYHEFPPDAMVRRVRSSTKRCAAVALCATSPTGPYPALN